MKLGEDVPALAYGEVVRLSPAQLSPAASLFHSLSDPTRLAILLHLGHGEQRVVDLTVKLGLAQSTVSKHLACLRECGLVESHPVGRASLFALTTRQELRDVLAAAERLLALDRRQGRPVSHVQSGRQPGGA